MPISIHDESLASFYLYLEKRFLPIKTSILMVTILVPMILPEHLTYILDSIPSPPPRPSALKGFGTPYLLSEWDIRSLPI